MYWFLSTTSRSKQYSILTFAFLLQLYQEMFYINFYQILLSKLVNTKLVSYNLLISVIGMDNLIKCINCESMIYAVLISEQGLVVIVISLVLSLSLHH